jgi:hypothetical protein
MSAYSHQAVELTLTLILSHLLAHTPTSQEYSQHVPPSFRRSRSTYHLFSAPLLHLSTRTYQTIFLVQPPTLLQRRRDRRTRDLRLLWRFRRLLLHGSSPFHKEAQAHKVCTGPRAFPRPTSRALQPQYLAVHLQASRRRRCALSRHLTRRRARVRRRRWCAARQEGQSCHPPIYTHFAPRTRRVARSPHQEIRERRSEQVRARTAQTRLHALYHGPYPEVPLQRYAAPWRYLFKTPNLLQRTNSSTSR